MKKTSFSANRVALAVAVICAGASVPAFAQVEAKVTGRVHFDARNLGSNLPSLPDRDTASAADNFEIRRARIGIVGTINKDIAYEVVGNAVGSTTNFVDTGWVNYGFNKAAQFRGGRFKQPFSLEELTSSNSIDFMERSYGNQMVPGKKLGMMLHGEPLKGLNYGVSAFQNDFSEASNSTNAGNNYAVRVALNAADFTSMEDTVLHFGVANTGGRSQLIPTTSGNTEKTAETGTRATIVSLRSEDRGLANVYRAQIGGDVVGTAGYGISANNVTNVDKNMNGMELALAKGPFKFQMENFDSKFNASGTTVDYPGKTTTKTATYDVRVKAQYMEFMYNITGEDFSKSYKGGAFSSISPKSVFMKDYGGVVGNGIGAWQIGVRQSSYDATDSNSVDGVSKTLSTTSSISTCVPSGSPLACTSTVQNSLSAVGNRTQNSAKAKTNTYALNWIMNSNARVMLNYAETTFGSKVEALDTASGPVVEKERVISVRTQVNF
jgi:phosphate-selective porin OprO/OprP